MKLSDQYRLLHREFDHHPAEPGMTRIAELWSCTVRNARLQLSRMQQAGWLSWQPARGRGHRGTLRLLKEPDELDIERLGTLLARGELEKAFANLNVAQRERLASHLPAYLPAGDDLLQLRMAIARAPDSLDPPFVVNRLEGHLVRQLFDRLCEVDPISQQLTPGLAHHWETDRQGRQWRFWLRPGLRFHDGQPLDAEAVRKSLLRLARSGSHLQPLFAHLEQVVVHHPHAFTCQLSSQDWLWPNRLVTAGASIVPPRRQRGFDRLPVGSGPFRLAINSEHRLRLEAFAGHHGPRALLDRIELWVIRHEAAARQCFDVRLDQHAEPGSQQLETGCFYLMCNPQRPVLREASARRGLIAQLARLRDTLPAGFGLQAARQLIPQWTPHMLSGESAPLPAGTRLRLRTAAYPAAMALARRLEALLAEAGIALEIVTIDNPCSPFAPWWPDMDLVLQGEVFHDDLDFACFEWFGANHLLQNQLGKAGGIWMKRQLQAVQEMRLREARLQAYQGIGDRLQDDGLLMPLAHQLAGARGSSDIAGLEPGHNGWMPFATLWRKA